MTEKFENRKKIWPEKLRRERELRGIDSRAKLALEIQKVSGENVAPSVSILRDWDARGWPTHPINRYKQLLAALGMTARQGANKLFLRENERDYIEKIRGKR